MKKLGAISWILCIALLLQVLSVPVMADETQPQESLDATVSTESIDVTAPPTPEDLPDYYGKNLDALYDCLCEIKCDIELVNAGEVDSDIIETFEDAASENELLTFKVL